MFRFIQLSCKVKKMLSVPKLNGLIQINRRDRFKSSLNKGMDTSEERFEPVDHKILFINKRSVFYNE
ncbi:hypothetical protein DS031_14425 [Bacillus taeanensis]|uniref:Uncharacterized protein n=1 Tax=Bacillus taeanensis TaxID=273032 RepID=A0A366XXQ4_9BACI|nr:hypothetical protein DS031_14425 [Bacillus taeanensis]